MYKTYHNLSVETICHSLNEVFNTSLNQSRVFRMLKFIDKNNRLYFNYKNKKITSHPENTTIKILELSHPFVNLDVDKVQFKSVLKAGLQVLKSDEKSKLGMIREYLCWYDTVLNISQEKKDVSWFKLFLIDLRDIKNENI